MVDLIEFRSAKLTIDGDNLTFAVKASIEEKWDTIEYPKYLDSAAVATVPTLKKIFIHVRRRYMPSSTLHSQLDGTAVTLAFIAGGDTYNFSRCKVQEWKVYGELSGEMMEEVLLHCEEES